MLALLIDTSTERGMVAVVDNDALLFHVELPFGHQHSKHLLPTIEEALKQTGLKLPQLTFIGLGVGPGSYTGIRMGASVAKTLAFAAQLPLVGVSTLKEFIPDTNGPFAVMLDARISGVYLLTGVCQDGKVQYDSDPRACTLEEASKILQTIDLVVTPNKKRLETLWKAPPWKWLETGPNPLLMANHALQNYEAGLFSTDSSVELLYLRPWARS